MVAGVPALTPYGAGSFDLTQAPTGFGFSMANATYGSFLATSGVIVSQSATFLDLYLLGDYTPGVGLLPATDVTESSLRVSINQNGDSISIAATLNSPAVPLVPEPTSIALVGCGLMGLVVGRRARS